jgi:hypothetical protein
MPAVEARRPRQLLPAIQKAARLKQRSQLTQEAPWDWLFAMTSDIFYTADASRLAE